jgi:hypothetical protein
VKEKTNKNQDIITQLQSVMLKSVVQEVPLPGQTEPVRFPDLAFIKEAPKITVSEDNISGQLDTSAIEKPVEIGPLSELREKAAKSGDQFFVYFPPANEQEGRITIVMELRMAPTEVNIQPLGLGGIRATFTQKTGGNWEVVDPPVIYGI